MSSGVESGQVGYELLAGEALWHQSKPWMRAAGTFSFKPKGGRHAEFKGHIEPAWVQVTLAG